MQIDHSMSEEAWTLLADLAATGMGYFSPGPGDRPETMREVQEFVDKVNAAAS